MDYQNEMPFSSYSALVQAINKKQAKLSFQRTSAYDLSCRSGYSSTILGSLGIVLGLLVLLVYSFIIIHNYWVVLFAIILFPLKAIIPYTKKFLIPAGIILGVLPYIIHDYNWLSAVGFSLIAYYVGYEVWWDSVYQKAKSMLLNDQDLFEKVWLSGMVAVKTNNDIR
jgi:hypothetical protein